MEKVYVIIHLEGPGDYDRIHIVSEDPGQNWWPTLEEAEAAMAQLTATEEWEGRDDQETLTIQELQFVERSDHTKNPGHRARDCKICSAHPDLA